MARIRLEVWLAMMALGAVLILFPLVEFNL